MMLPCEAGQRHLFPGAVMTRRLLYSLAGGAIFATVGLVYAAHAGDDPNPPTPLKLPPRPPLEDPLQDPALKKKYPFESVVPRLEYEKKRGTTDSKGYFFLRAGSCKG